MLLVVPLEFNGLTPSTSLPTFSQNLCPSLFSNIFVLFYLIGSLVIRGSAGTECVDHYGNHHAIFCEQANGNRAINFLSEQWTQTAFQHFSLAACFLVFSFAKVYNF